MYCYIFYTVQGMVEKKNCKKKCVLLKKNYILKRGKEGENEKSDGKAFLAFLGTK